MLIWWLLSPLLHLAVVSSCVTGVPSNRSMDCSKEERGVNSFLWTISRPPPLPPSYLFGTIHVPYDRVWSWVPDNSKEAFTHSDSAVFELDLTNPYTLTALAQCQMLPAGQTLSDLIPGPLYSRLQRHLDYVRHNMAHWMSQEQKRKGLFADYLFSAIAGNWRRKRPVWVMLMVNSLTETDVKSRGIPVLDLYLAQQAEQEGKVTGAVERVEEQCVPLNQLNLSQVLFALNQTLSQHERLRDDKSRPACSSDALIQHYNCGDLNSLMLNRDTIQVPALVNASLPAAQLHKARRIEEYFQHELIDKRNARMSARVVALLTAHPHTSFFFAFGAGHFLGRENVVERLRTAGLDVVHTAPGVNVTRSDKSRARRPRKSRKFVLSDDFPQPSDVIYGDIQYLFDKRKIRHNKRYRKERRKLMRAKKRREKLESLWDNLDPDSLNPDRYTRVSAKKHPDSGRRKNTFNDLWVRTDQIRPRYLQQMGESTYVQGVSTQQHASLPRDVSDVSSQASATLPALTWPLPTLLLLLLCAILLPPPAPP
ncbi:metalloprotease TIKI1 [Aplysia californica]|uniref:Metalloprotease TIKI homolog n=1 Tax=Aplysia californica TaxID=6500 RepID=A0ABM1AB22_APLCA|nr:metalloprotease TIKI1 [Aplysia californica]